MLATSRWSPLASSWNPLAEMNRLRNEMDRLFGRWGLTEPMPFGVGVYPPLNLWQDDSHVYVEAELPGFELSNLETYVTGGNQLTIKGERKQPQRQGGVWHRQERGFGSFNRTIELPCDVNSENVVAEFKHGVLTITASKSEEVKPRRIAVKAA